ncbi:caspase family protein [Streptomyces mangrovisoli]|uniref:Peptidase C14 caspase domain-containing protein n=1 Tax=Streptomyces mangrovisoli TaxID=1428628 RepID=A0A1J4NVH1_9ACTN|nr:caspase family protein [Streptomyces mangrovisoli]OIJ65158.1 hypothetical protein WN71_025465 [Streptomyces mangrovisoli]
MGKIHALLVGIDTYPASVAPSLGGCLNDIAAARRLLDDLAGERAEVRVLRNSEATVEAVTDAVLRHLGAAGAGDLALLWFSGHGTQEPAHGGDLLIEATGLNQALVCVDGILLDKRLGVLLDTVAAGGARVTAVLDCCHSGGATRDRAARFAPPSPDWDFGPREHTTDAPDPQATPAGTPDPWAPPVGVSDPQATPGGAAADRAVPVVAAGPRHLLLAASRLDLPSYEDWFGGRRHGAFTYALVGAARAAGPAATGRELLSAASATVQRLGTGQRPVLFPNLHGGDADRPFLDGSEARPAESLLRFGPNGWEVDCGSAHGLPDGPGAEGTEFAVVSEGPGGRPLDGGGQVVAARSVRPERTLVEPVGWVPAHDRVYPVTVSALALPPGSVTLDGPPEVVAELTEAVRRAPLLRLADGPETAADVHFRVLVRDGVAHVLRRDGTPYTEPVALGGFRGPGEAAGRVANCLAHLTRWHRLRDLAPRPSPLDGLVRVEVAPWGAQTGEVLLPDASGEIVVPYRPGPDGPQAPWVSIRLHNRSPDRTLWCLLLDLTDRYASDPALYEGHFIGPGRTGHALDGDPVRLSLPAGRAEVPGAQARDWLKLIVAEGELNTAPFQLPEWSPRLPTGTRKLGPVLTGGAMRWTTATVPLRTVVPGPVPAGAADAPRAAAGRGRFTGPGA